MGTRALVLGGLALALAGCSPGEPARDKAWYSGHDKARASKLAACRADPGRLAATGNCINAVAADGEITSKRFWTVKPPAAGATAPGKL